MAVCKDRGAALLEAELEDVGLGERVRGSLLAQAVFLSLMDGQQARVDLRPFGSRVLAFNHLEELPECDLLFPVRSNPFSRQTLPDANVELALLFGGYVCVVQEIVGIGVEHAVGEDCRGQTHLPAQQRLQTAGRPGVAGCLVDVLGTYGRIEAACFTGHLLADGRKTVVQQQSKVLVLEIECASAKALKSKGQPFPQSSPARVRAWRTTQIPFNALQELFQASFPGDLLGNGECPWKWR